MLMFIWVSCSTHNLFSAFRRKRFHKLFLKQTIAEVYLGCEEQSSQDPGDLKFFKMALGNNTSFQLICIMEVS